MEGDEETSSSGDDDNSPTCLEFSSCNKSLVEDSPSLETFWDEVRTGDVIVIFGISDVSSSIPEDTFLDFGVLWPVETSREPIDPVGVCEIECADAENTLIFSCSSPSPSSHEILSSQAFQ